tara:strand:- start:146 stop:349 length:204 start_codon:yes stop_codon:yes gene_type:complete
MRYLSWIKAFLLIKNFGALQSFLGIFSTRHKESHTCINKLKNFGELQSFFGAILGHAEVSVFEIYLR